MIPVMETNSMKLLLTIIIGASMPVFGMIFIMDQQLDELNQSHETLKTTP